MSAAGGTEKGPHVFFELEPPGARRRLLEAAEKLRDNPLPVSAVLPNCAAAVFPLVGDGAVAAPFEQERLLLGGPIAPWFVQVEPQGIGNALISVLPPSAHAFHGPHERDDALSEAQTGIGNQQFGIERVLRAKAIALQAHPLRAVETE